MIRSLKIKFITVNMLLVFIVLSIVFSIFYWSSFQQQKSQSLSELSALLRWHEEDRNDDHYIKLPKNFIRHPVLVIDIKNKDDLKILFSDNIKISEINISELIKKALLNKKSEGFLKEYNFRYMTNKNQIAFLEISHEKTFMLKTFLISFFSLVGSMFIFFVISFFLAKWILKPVEQSWLRQKRFIADASHELKTPLTVILANNKILKSNQNQIIKSQMNWIENSEAEANRMKSLIESLLFLAKSDDAKISITYDKINLSDLILNTCLSFEALAFEKGITLDIEKLSQDIYVKGDASQIRQLFSIFLDNAIKYSNKKSIVYVSVGLVQSRVFFSVQNEGVVISDEDQKYLFERFYRADKARSKGGYGLGLSIAKSIADLYKCKINIESKKDNGTKFTVYFQNNKVQNCFEKIKNKKFLY